ncbi:hypothetical protein AVEN_117076-1 [Araneus ventricosus]|uniref:Uncharacterized protein n=1 Tax=Araneus ventricosus TaxID=182803 RepID=A0A4Y2RDM1_ARAVE|nr:hypothetical protein AVEN_117076-1 [Araneus ventricosus]
MDVITNLCVQCDITAISSDNVVSTLKESIKNSNLHLKYVAFSKPNLCPNEIKHDVKLLIETNVQPILSKARQLDPKRLAIAKAELKFMFDNEIIGPRIPQWSSPLHFVTKEVVPYRPHGYFTVSLMVKRILTDTL